MHRDQKMARVDRIIPQQKMPEYYSDFTMNLDKNLVTGQLLRITNADAVKEALINLVLTGQKERPYQPWLGSKVRQSLFDNIDDELTIDSIKTSVEECIQNNDVRAKVIRVNVQPDNERNGYNVEIIFSIINIQQPIVAQIFLSRVR